MDEQNAYGNTKPLPVKKANLLSRFTFWWSLPLLKKGFRSELKTHDLFEVHDEHLAGKIGAQLEKAWLKELEEAKLRKTQVNFSRCLRRTFGCEFALIGILIFFDQCIFKILQPILLVLLIHYFSVYPSIDKVYGYILGILLIIVTFLDSIAIQSFFHNILLLGVKMRIACSSLIYRKLLKMNKTSLNDTTTGKVTNIFSNDIFRFESALMNLHFMWTTPIQAGVCFYLLWKIWGVASLAGISTVVAYLPLQVFLGFIFSYYREKTAKRSDKRIELMNEIVNAMKIIKMYAWEEPFMKMIAVARRKEMDVIKTTALFKTINQSAYYYFPKVILFLTIVWFSQSGRFLTAEILFSAAGLYNIFRLSFGYFFPLSFSSLGEMRISCKRIQECLLTPENDISERVRMHLTNPEESRICVSKLKGHWGLDDKSPVINDLSFEVKKGEIMCIIGRTGSGKSSVLHALVGDVNLTSGSADIYGSLALVTQEAWIFNASIRQNVVFGLPFDDVKYTNALKYSELEKDLAILSKGDRTIVGDRGLTLSGGQKARVSLARALYRDADIYLLDDPLSAVDVHVGWNIFNNCICKYLRNKTVVLVTHQLQYLEQADKIMIINEGNIAGYGSYRELVDRGYDLSIYEDKDSNNEDEMSCIKDLTPEEEAKVIHSNSNAATEFNIDHEDRWETGQSGSISGKVYWKYIIAGTGCCGALQILIANVTVEASLIMFDMFLAMWTAKSQLLHNILSHIPLEPLLVLMLICIFITITSFLRTKLFFKVCLRSSTVLHDKMFNKIIRAPMAFFDSNPLGIILNRFSKDIGMMDDVLPLVFGDVFEIFCNTIGGFVLIVLSNLWLLIPSVLIFILTVSLRSFYIRTARALKRIESSCRSPVYNHLNSTLEGLTMIRTFSQKEKCIEEFDNFQNMYTSGTYLFWVVSRWQAIVCDMAMVIYLTFVIFIFLQIKTDAAGSKIGLAVSTLISMGGTVQWLIHQSSELENNMTSTERVMDYSKLEPEVDWSTSADVPLNNKWPQNGSISFRNVDLFYSPNIQVLKSLTFQIKPKEKIGIVGRTGAGKSSLITALFRLTEPSGDIIIDELPIRQLGLHDLRRNLSIIPQDPVLFSGTLRNNLDPFTQYCDEAIWEVLSEVGLKSDITKLEMGLQHSVQSSGTNFSSGQRQLLCLARAILKKNKILIMDEATANVDKTTDKTIQQIIRQKFKDCTILTVAHRLDTIIDSDRVMVLANGSILEFDDPFLLIENNESIFNEMVNQAGVSSGHLKEVCRKAYESRRLRESSKLKDVHEEN